MPSCRPSCRTPSPTTSPSTTWSPSPSRSATWIRAGSPSSPCRRCRAHQIRMRWISTRTRRPSRLRGAASTTSRCPVSRARRRPRARPPCPSRPPAASTALATGTTVDPASVQLTVVNVSGRSRGGHRGDGAAQRRRLRRHRGRPAGPPDAVQTGVTVEYDPTNLTAALTVAAAVPGATLVPIERAGQAGPAAARRGLRRARCRRSPPARASPATHGDRATAVPTSDGDYDCSLLDDPADVDQRRRRALRLSQQG